MVKQKNNNNRKGEDAIVVGIITGGLTALFFLMIFSLIMTVKDIPLVMVTVFAYLVLLSSSFIGGFFASIKAKKQGIKNGAIIGGIVFFLFFLVGILVNGFSGDISFLLKGFVSVLSGAIGGIIGVNRTGKRKMQY